MTAERGQPGPEVVTTAGRVRGETRGGVHVFRGIPYAEPPTGPLRYRRPVPPSRWAGVRPCVQPGPHSMQGSARRGVAARPVPKSEDCLSLNVWTPAPDDAGRAVLVYVHGGGYLIGSGSEAFQSGDAYAREDVVLVTFNHRLGALGFLHLDELFDGLSGTGNLGLHDTVRVLEWVQENIRAFGGDPGRVTLAGHSSGGITAVTLMGSARARGLFRAAIPISSASGNSWLEPAEATAVSRRVLASWRVRPGDLDQLLARTAADCVLSADLANDLYDVAGGHPFGPVRDGDLVSAPPIESIRAGAGADVDLLVGHMDEEFRLCVFDDTGQVRDPPLNMGVKTAGFDVLGLLRHTGRPAAEILGTYTRSLRAAGREVSAPEMFCQAASDLVMLNPGVSLAEAHSHYPARTRVFRFAWRPPAGDGKVGACHGIDIPYFFHQLDADFWAPLYQGCGDPGLADRYHGCMAAMARTGDPRHAGLPDWPQYEPERRAVLVFGPADAVVDDPDAERRRLFDGSPPFGYAGRATGPAAVTGPATGRR